MDIVIKNGTVVNAGDSFRADVGIQNGSIVALGTDLSGMENIDATGKFILPGLIETNAFLESSFKNTRSVDNFFRGTQAAASGGITTIIDRVMPEVDEKLSEAVQARRNLADPQVAVDYSLHICVPNYVQSLASEIHALIESGYPSYEVFMAHRNPDQVLSDKELLELMKTLSESSGLLMLHCGSQALLEHLQSQNTLPEHSDAIPAFTRLWPPDAEAAGVLKAVSMARHFDTPLFLHNLSSADAIEILSQYQHLMTRVKASCSLHHLTHTESHYATPEGRNYACVPPLRSEYDRNRLWGGLSSGLIQNIASSHRAFTQEQKKLGEDMLSIPSGFATFSALLSVVYDQGVGHKHINLMRMVGLLSAWPAQIFGLESKGAVSVGKDADLVIFDPMIKRSLSSSLMFSESDYSLYEGLEIQGAVEMTLSRGKIVYDSGKFVGEQGAGQFVPRRL